MRWGWGQLSTQLADPGCGGTTFARRFLLAMLPSPMCGSGASGLGGHQKRTLLSGVVGLQYDATSDGDADLPDHADLRD